MPISITLDDARADLINLAAIDGKTGANGRHSPTNLARILNRKYRALRTRVSQLGMPQFLESTAALTIPAIASNEDFIEIPMPALTAEIIGVDVRVGAGGGWSKLDPLEFEQRRDVPMAYQGTATPWYMYGPSPPNGVGWWFVNKAPTTVASSTITAGTVALLPGSLSGQYKLHSVQAWTDITNGAHVFLLYEGWDEWFINAAVMAVCQRDKNKADNYQMAADAWKIADDLIVAAAARLQRSGYAVPSNYGGIVL